MKWRAPLIFLLVVLTCIVSVNRCSISAQNGFRHLARFVPQGNPVAGSFSSLFGMRRHPIRRFNQFHKGIDIAGTFLSPVHATAGGQVKWAGWRSGYGRCVILDHGHGWETLYAHLNASTLRAGNFVGMGQVVGQLGKSGETTGAHLHYEVRYLGEPQNPIYFIAGSGRPMFSQLENSYPEVSSRHR